MAVGLQHCYAAHLPSSKLLAASLLLCHARFCQLAAFQCANQTTHRPCCGAVVRAWRFVLPVHLFPCAHLLAMLSPPLVTRLAPLPTRSVASMALSVLPVSVISQRNKAYMAQLQHTVQVI